MPKERQTGGPKRTDTTQAGSIFGLEQHPNPTARIFVESQRRSPNDPLAFKHLLNSVRSMAAPERFVETVGLIDFQNIGQAIEQEFEYRPPGIPPEEV